MQEMLLVRHAFLATETLKVNARKKEYHANRLYMRAGAAVLISRKTDCKHRA
jgi:hypothetical protein